MFDMCLYPRFYPNPKYKKNKKNQGIIPTLKDERVLFVPVGCKECMECRKQKANEWRVRLNEEYRTNNNGHFVSLTFSNNTIRRLNRKLVKRCKKEGRNMPEHYDLDIELANLGREYFLERWRKHQGKWPRYWLITELGHEGTENIHLHGVIWTKDKTNIKKFWGEDFCYIGYSFNESVINYMVKYVTKVDKDHKFFKPRIWCSNGIGKGYTNRDDSRRNKYLGTITDESYKDRAGFKWSLPIYYRNKIYNDDEKEQLWINKLDKEERWVLGQRIDVSQGYEAYDRAVEYARRKNERLGFGKPKDDSEEDQAREKYEKDRRFLMMYKRMNDLQIDFDIDSGEVFE